MMGFPGFAGAFLAGGRMTACRGPSIFWATRAGLSRERPTLLGSGPLDPACRAVLYAGRAGLVGRGCRFTPAWKVIAMHESKPPTGPLRAAVPYAGAVLLCAAILVL